MFTIMKLYYDTIIIFHKQIINRSKHIKGYNFIRFIDIELKHGAC